MNNEIQPVTENLEDSFVYSCSFDKSRGHEYFVSHHILSFQFSGETHIEEQSGKLILRESQLLLSRKNQLTKASKIPADHKEYKSVSILLTEAVLQQYLNSNPVSNQKYYKGEANIVLKSDMLLEGYFHSLLPYVESTQKINKRLATVKINEAIELLLHHDPDLKNFLFDFSAPHKIDLEKFMLKNFHYNVSLDKFAKLTGRSLASFKRDFEKIFHSSPRKWLQERRLDEAHLLITEKRQKPTEIFLDLGFENLSHFYTSFKQRFGITPAEILV